MAFSVHRLRLKIGVIKEQQSKNLKKRKKLNKKTFASRKFSAIAEILQKRSRILNLDYAVAKTFAKNAEKGENRETFRPRKFLPLKWTCFKSLSRKKREKEKSESIISLFSFSRFFREREFPI